MEPIALFGIQFTMSLVAYGLIAFWYLVPRLASLPREAATWQRPRWLCWHSSLSAPDSVVRSRWSGSASSLGCWTP